MTLTERYHKYEDWRDRLPECFAVILYAWERFLVGLIILLPGVLITLALSILF